MTAYVYDDGGRSDAGYKGKAYVIKVYPDEDANGLNGSRGWSNLGTMVCWHSRYNLGDRQIGRDEFDSLDDLIERLDARVLMPLYLSDHSGLRMSTGTWVGRAQPADWDTGHVGFIYATAEDLRNEYDVSDITQHIEAKAREALEGEVAVYDQELSGDVYGYVIETPEGVVVESLWGIYGFEDAIAEAEAAVANLPNCGGHTTCIAVRT